MKFQYPYGATPLDEDYRQDLIPDIQTQAELNEFEQKNILQAMIWAQGNSRFPKRIITPVGLCELHRHMFGSTWRWAGKYRKRDTNIGIAWLQIPENIALICQDTDYWIVHQVYPWSELVVRLHHRLVQVHPFPNGNGRHARFVADLLLRYHDQPVLHWGGQIMDHGGDVRKEYIEALREADKQSFERLIQFACSESH